MTPVPYLEIVQELLGKKELIRIFENFNNKRISFLVLKGAHYAYQIYHQPHLRPRCDTDILVADSDWLKTTKLLENLGYTERPQLNIFNERLYVFTDSAGLEHNLDLHLKLSNRSYFSSFFDFQKLLVNRQRIPSLGKEVYGLGLIDSLLYSVVHDLAHHYQSDDPVTLSDIYLIWKRMSAEEKKNTFLTARRLKISKVVNHKLKKAHEGFPAEVFISPPDEPDSFVVRRFAGKINWWEMLFWDLCFLPGWTERVQFLREFIWPHSAYFKPLKKQTLFSLRLNRIIKACIKSCLASPRSRFNPKPLSSFKTNK